MPKSLLNARFQVTEYRLSWLPGNTFQPENRSLSRGRRRISPASRVSTPPPNDRSAQQDVVPQLVRSPNRRRRVLIVNASLIRDHCKLRPGWIQGSRRLKKRLLG